MRLRACRKTGSCIGFRGRDDAGPKRSSVCIRIPMREDIRSLNLSNSAAIVLYEALRQNAFAGLQENGELHRLSWKG